MLKIEHREIAPAVAVVALTGRLMLGAEVEQVESVVGGLLDQGYRGFVFDLVGVSHIDSTGIGRCIASLNKITKAGGKLHMAAAAGQVREGFRVTRLDRIFRFFDTVEAASAGLP